MINADGIAALPLTPLSKCHQQLSEWREPCSSNCLHLKHQVRFMFDRHSLISTATLSFSGGVALTLSQCLCVCSRAALTDPNGRMYDCAGRAKPGSPCSSNRRRGAIDFNGELLELGDVVDLAGVIEITIPFGEPSKRAFVVTDVCTVGKGIDDHGVGDLAEALKSNRSVTSINLPCKRTWRARDTI